MFVCGLQSCTFPWVSYDYSCNTNRRYLATLFLNFPFSFTRIWSYFPSCSITCMNLQVFPYFSQKGDKLGEPFCSQTRERSIQIKFVSCLTNKESVKLQEQVKRSLYCPHSAYKCQLEFCLFYLFQGLDFQENYTVIYLGETLFISIIMVENIWLKVNTTALHFINGVLVSEEVGKSILFVAWFD